MNMKIFKPFLLFPLVLVSIVFFGPSVAEGFGNIINTSDTTDTTNTTYRPDTSNATSEKDKTKLYDSRASETVYTAPVSFTNSVVYNTTYRGILYYQATKSVLDYYYVAGLDSPAISVGYNGKIYNDQTKALITSGSAIPIGTVLRFDPSLGDITFNATGGTWGTPYGVWYDKAGFPDGPTFSFVGDERFTYRGARCSDIYKVGSIIGGIYNDYSLYVPFSVHPPTPSVAVSGDARLTRVSDNVYRVDTAGAIKAVLTFPATYGKFYYEYKRPSDGCHTSWDVIPMTTASKSLVSITIPVQTLTYTLTALDNSNNPPAAPTITSTTVITDGSGNHSASRGSLQTFNFQATDPEGGAVRYAIDWFNDGTVTGYSPASGYVASGAVSSSNYSLPVSGTTYTFKARTEDSKGGVSGWTSYTVALISGPPSVLKICQDSCNSAIIRGKGGTTTSFGLARGTSQGLVACYNTAAGCSDPSGNVTSSTDWLESNTPSNALSLSTVAGKKRVTGDAVGTEKFTASYSGGTPATMTVSVTCVASNTCSSDSQYDQVCKGAPFTIADGCGNTVSCTGNRYCDFNWKEVSP